MAIERINVGQIANDGTGDDLREAMIKINTNFDDLDTRFPEAATGTNLGNVGEGIFSNAINSELRFKRLIAGNNITLTSNPNTITIDGATSLDQLIVVSDGGTLTVERGQTMAINGGNGIVTRVSGQNLVIDANAGVLAADTAPQLSATLNANNQNITNAGYVTATQFNGALEGLVYGVDIRTISGFYTDFEFGEFLPEYTSIIQWLQGQVDVDFGTFIAPGLVAGEVDGGTFA